MTRIRGNVSVCNGRRKGVLKDSLVEGVFWVERDGGGVLVKAALLVHASWNIEIYIFYLFNVDINMFSIY